MKGAAGPKKASSGKIQDSFIDNHPKMLNIFFFLAFVFLAGSAAFLISDIWSFGAGGSHKALMSDYQFLIPREIAASIASWQAMGLNLIDKGKNQALNSDSQKSTFSSQKRDNIRVLRTKNPPIEAKRTLADAKLPNLSPASMNSSKSSRNKTLILPAKSSATHFANNRESGSGSGSPIKIDSIQRDKNYYDVNSAVSNDSGENGLQISRQMADDGSIDSITDNLPVLKIAADSNYSSDGLAFEDNINISFNNSTSFSMAIEPMQIDSGSDDSNNRNSSMALELDDSINSNTEYLNFTGPENPGSIYNSSYDASSSSTSIEEIASNYTDSSSVGRDDSVNTGGNDSFDLSAQVLEPIDDETSTQQAEDNRSRHSLSENRDSLIHHAMEINNISSPSIAHDMSLVNNTSIIDSLTYDESIAESPTDDVSINDSSMDNASIADSSIDDVSINDGSMDNPSITDSSTDDVSINDIPMDNASITSSSSDDVSINDSSTNNISFTDDSATKRPDILLNNVSDKSNRSIESHEKSENISSQNSELEQIQPNDQTKSATNVVSGSRRSSNMPLLQKVSQNMEEVKTIDEDVSATLDDESDRSQSDSSSRFKRLKINAPSWMARS